MVATLIERYKHAWLIQRQGYLNSDPRPREALPEGGLVFKCLFRRSRPPIPGEAVLLFRAKASTDSEGDAVGISGVARVRSSRAVGADPSEIKQYRLCRHLPGDSCHLTSC